MKGEIRRQNILKLLSKEAGPLSATILSKKFGVSRQIIVKDIAKLREVGAAISPINSTLGMVLWAPALLYLGADIYDKYKNEDKTYSPDGKRSLKQAVFQGLSSVVLPTAVIKAGQKVGVHIAKEKGALSATDKKELIEFSMEFLENSDYPKEDNSDIGESMVNAFKHKVKANQKRLQKKGFLSKIASIFIETKGPEHAMSKYLKNPKDENQVVVYLKEQGKIATDILTSEANIHSDRYKKYFKNVNRKFESVEIARKETVLKILKEKNINKSIAATVSGLVALFVFAKPIDILAEHFIMPKLINPLIDRIPAKNKRQEKQP